MDKPVEYVKSTSLDIPQQTNKNKRIFFFEIACIVTSLILLFGALNYFNILSLSKFFPQLGFLPHITQNISTTKPKPTPAVGFGDLKPYAKFCKEFQKTQAKISCEKAIELALAQKPGKVKNVTIEPVRTSILSSSGIPERQTVNMWLIDIELTSPYFDKMINKEIHTLRVGYRLDDANGMYEKAID
jgi:hypothetical protein